MIIMGLQNAKQVVPAGCIVWAWLKKATNDQRTHKNRVRVRVLGLGVKGLELGVKGLGLGVKGLGLEG